MCGIAGILGVPRDRAEPAALRMRAALGHRGPDGLGLEIVSASEPAEGPPAVLVHARLAVIDLSPDGRQPMSDRPAADAARPNWLVFNGEIYNYRELRPDLERAGWPCRTASDSEVILHAYRAWGEDAVARLRGMFAWCLLDVDHRRAWLCRDRLGIKPLYLRPLPEGGLLFASELRALLAAGTEFLPPIVDRAALESFLAQGAVWGEQSIVAGVRLLGPGESLTVDWQGRSIRQKRYWRLDDWACRDDSARDDRDRPRAVARLGELLRESVRLRLLSDVPLGVFLSGGVDSGAIATIATEVAGAAVQTLSVGFDQPEFDETATAAEVARALGTEHRRIHLTGQTVLDGLPEALAAVDQPTVDGFNTFFVSRAARQAGLTVALSGVGGDELFGGYASFRDVPRAARLRHRLRWARPFAPVLAGAARLSGGRRGVKAQELFTREPDLLSLYLLRRELVLPRERRLLHPRPPECDPTRGLTRAVLEELEAPDSLGAINRVSHYELAGYMRHMLLRDADVFSMAHGLELRVPLLDHVLVQAALGMPGRWKRPGRGKRPGPLPKPLLIDAVGPRLPSVVLQGPKRGFTFPWGPWLRGPLRAHAAQAMARDDLWRALGLDPQAPRALWGHFLAGAPRVAALQVLALWVLGDYAARHALRGPS